MSALACPFCSAFAVSEDLLQVHCLDLHPLEHLLTRDEVEEELLARRRADKEAEGAEETGKPPKPDSSQDAPPPDPEPPLESTQPQPLGSPDSADEELRIVDESPEHHMHIVDESPSPESSPAPEGTDDLPQSLHKATIWEGRPHRSLSSSKVRLRSASPEAFSGDRPSSTRRGFGESANFQPLGGSRDGRGKRKRAVVWPEWSGRPRSSSPAASRRVKIRRSLSKSPPRNGQTPTTGELQALAKAAPRCRHNLRLCRDFPNCGGRSCERRHPLCPREDYKACLGRNTCGFEHCQYEKACDRCEGRLPQASQARLPVLCGHVRGIECRSVAAGTECNFATECLYSHGLCRQGEACDRKGCVFEHPGQAFLCRKCAKKTEQWKKA